MHDRDKLARTNVHVCLDFQQISNTIKVTLLASPHQCCEVIFSHGIHIGTPHFMQGLLDNINVLLQRNIHKTHHTTTYTYITTLTATTMPSTSYLTIASIRHTCVYS